MRASLSAGPRDECQTPDLTSGHSAKFVIRLDGNHFVTALGNLASANEAAAL
jgi:hypothetical protein